MGLQLIKVIRMLIPLINLSFDATAMFAGNLELINQRRLRILVHTENVHHTKLIVHGKLVFISVKIQILYVLPNLYRSITINVILKLLNLHQKTYDFHNKLQTKLNTTSQIEIQVLNSNINCLFENILSIVEPFGFVRRLGFDLFGNT